MDREFAVTVSQAGRLLGLSRDGVLRAVKAGKFGEIKTSRAWTRIPVSAVEAYAGRKIAPSELAKPLSTVQYLQKRLFDLRLDIFGMIEEAVKERDKMWRSGPPSVSPYVLAHAVLDKVNLEGKSNGNRQ